MRFRMLLTLTAFSTALGLLGPVPATAQPAAPGVSSGVTAVGPTVKLRLTGTSAPVAADWVVLTGVAPKALVGAPVALQRKPRGKGWTSAVSAKVGRNGNFSFRTRATGIGGYTYRAVVARTKRTVSATSNSVGLTVFRWFFLSDLQRVASNGLDQRTSVTMAGVQYFASRRLAGYNGETHWVDYNASYRCRELRSTLGIDDGAAAAAVVHDQLLADGTSIAQSDPVVGKTVPLQVDLTGVFRVRLQSSFTVPRGSSPSLAYAGWGDARMLCSGAP